MKSHFPEGPNSLCRVCMLLVWQDSLIVSCDWGFLCLRMFCVHTTMLPFRQIYSKQLFREKVLITLPLYPANCSISPLSLTCPLYMHMYTCVCVCVVPSGTLRWDTTAPTHPSSWWAPSWICEMTRTPLRGCETRSFPPSPTRRAWLWQERLVRLCVPHAQLDTLCMKIQSFIIIYFATNERCTYTSLIITEIKYREQVIIANQVKQDESGIIYSKVVRTLLQSHLSQF